MSKHTTFYHQPLGGCHCHESIVFAGRFVPGGLRFVSGSGDRMGILWDAAPEDLPFLPRLGGYVSTCTFSPDGAGVLVSTSSGGAALWEPESGRVRSLGGVGETRATWLGSSSTPCRG